MTRPRVVAVGLGRRLRTVLDQIERWTPGVDLVAAVDPARESISAAEPRYADLAWSDDVTALLDATSPDGVLIGTRCDLHADLAAEVVRRGVPLFVEKPVAITSEQVDRLALAAHEATSETVVSFPLRLSELCLMAKEIIESGAIGEPQHAVAVNNVPFYAKTYYQGWMRDDAITGGLWLQKATHDLDYLTFLLGEYPTRVTAVESTTVFAGDMPAGLHCRQCPRRHSCPESQESAVRNLQLGSYGAAELYFGGDWQCAFATDTGNHDSATAILQYASGKHAVYSQNFYSRNGAARRGITVTGYDGTVAFDWYRGSLEVSGHHKPRSQVHTVTLPDGGHFGGDVALAQDFYAIVTGTGRSRATLADGIASARLCVAARESCRTGAAVEVD